MSSQAENLLRDLEEAETFEEHERLIAQLDGDASAPLDAVLASLEDAAPQPDELALPLRVLGLVADSLSGRLVSGFCVHNRFSLCVVLPW